DSKPTSASGTKSLRSQREPSKQMAHHHSIRAQAGALECGKLDQPRDLPVDLKIGTRLASRASIPAASGRFASKLTIRGRLARRRPLRDNHAVSWTAGDDTGRLHYCRADPRGHASAVDCGPMRAC